MHRNSIKDVLKRVQLSIGRSQAKKSWKPLPLVLRPLVSMGSSAGDIPIDVSYIVIEVRISPRPNGSTFISAKVAGAVTALVVDDVGLAEREEEVAGDGTAGAA